MIILYILLGWVALSVPCTFLIGRMFLNHIEELEEPEHDLIWQLENER